MLEVLPAPPVGSDPGFSEMSDADLHDHYVECRRREVMAAAEAAAALAEIDRRRSHVTERFLSLQAFVAFRTGDSQQAAAGRVRMARQLQEMPATARAFADGDIDAGRVRRLMDAREAAPEPFSRDETELLDRAGSQDAATFANTVGIWRQNQAREHSRVEEREQHRRRRLTLSETLEGTVRLGAELDRVSAETIGAAIESLAGPANRDGDDGRTPTQRRVDALTEICRHHLDSDKAPIVGGNRPHLNVIVDVDALTGGVTSRSEIGHHKLLGPAAREFLACDATVCGVLMKGSHEILEMGRKVRTATPAQRRALAIRDGGCVIPGCDRPPEWCDAHHEIPWIEGGATDIDEMRLVCTPHHYMIHLGHLELPKLE